MSRGQWGLLWVLCSIFFFALSGCTAKSGQGQRFQESHALSAPSLTVSLSTNDNFTFAIVGDLHVGGQNTTRLRKILTQMQSENDAFLILLGDTTDKGKLEDVVAVRSALTDFGYDQKTLFVIGNHDIFEDGWNAYKALEGPTHFSTTIGNATFIALDTADGTVGKEQFDWLSDSLAKRKTTHTFLLSHYLPVVPGQRTYLKLANEDEAHRLMKLATRHKVTAWLGAHYHSYITESIEGVSYVVAGGGGGRRMEPIKDFFFVQVTVNGTQITYELKPI